MCACVYICVCALKCLCVHVNICVEDTHTYMEYMCLHSYLQNIECVYVRACVVYVETPPKVSTANC